MNIQEMGWSYGLCYCGSVQGHVAGSCERGNELSGSIKSGEHND